MAEQEALTHAELSIINDIQTMYARALKSASDTVMYRWHIGKTLSGIGHKRSDAFFDTWGKRTQIHPHTLWECSKVYERFPIEEDVRTAIKDHVAKFGRELTWNKLTSEVATIEDASPVHAREKHIITIARIEKQLGKIEEETAKSMHVEVLMEKAEALKEELKKTNEADQKMFKIAEIVTAWAKDQAKARTALKQIVEILSEETK